MKKMSIFGVVKIVLMGDFATGKTTLKRSFMGMHLDERYMSTLGVDLASYNHKDEDMTIKYQIWDLGGQEEFAEIRRKQYKGAEGGLLVFDKSRDMTFENLDTWLDEINSSIDTTVYLLILGNKDDLVSEEVNKEWDEKALKYIKDNISTYTNIKLLGYFSTCALHGSNVEKAFVKIGREIINRKSDQMMI